MLCQSKRQAREGIKPKWEAREKVGFAPALNEWDIYPATVGVGALGQSWWLQVCWWIFAVRRLQCFGVSFFLFFFHFLFRQKAQSEMGIWEPQRVGSQAVAVTYWLGNGNSSQNSQSLILHGDALHQSAVRMDKSLQTLAPCFFPVLISDLLCGLSFSMCLILSYLTRPWKRDGEVVRIS